MKEQNFKNHVNYVPLYHYLTFFLMFVMIVGSVISIINANENNTLISWLLLLSICITISVSFHNRSFALKAQDRVIRAEENLRYFMLTGKRLDKRITLEQLIGLRFADDDEFIKLVDRTLKENLSKKEIKKAIKNWRADHYRA